MKRLGMLILGIWCGLTTQCLARDIYVNNVNGDDRQDGTSAVVGGHMIGPVRSIAQALRLADRGDRVVVADTGQPYRESITLQAGRHSGSPQVPFELIGNGAVLDGTREVPVGAWNHTEGEVFRFRPTRLGFQVLYLDGKPAERVSVADKTRLKELQPTQWCWLAGNVYFCVEPGRLPQSYALSYTALPVGITLYEVRHVVVRDLVVQGFQLDGVNAHDGVWSTRLVSLTCRGNGRAGISVGGASRVRIESCLIGNNGVAQLRTEGYSHTELVGCDLLDNTAPRIVRDGGDVAEAQ